MFRGCRYDLKTREAKFGASSLPAGAQVGLDYGAFDLSSIDSVDDINPALPIIRNIT